MQDPDKNNEQDLDQTFDDYEDEGYYDDMLDETFESEDDLYDVDDFEDEVSALPDQENWNQDMDESLLKKEKKSRPNLSFNTIVIMGAIIVGLIVLVYQVTTKRPSSRGDGFVSTVSPTGINADQTAEEKGSLQNQLEANNSESDNQDKGFLFEPDVLDSMEMDISNKASESVLPQPTSVVEDNSAILDEESIVTPYSSDIQIQEQQLVSENIEDTVDSLMREENSVEDVLLLPEEEAREIVDVQSPVTVPQSQPSQPTSTVSVDLSGLEKKLDSIVMRLDDMEVQINQVQGVSDTKISELQKEIQKIKTTPVAALKTASPISKQSKSEKTAQDNKPAQQSVQQTPQVKWELRAAQPGKAWLSQKGLSEMRPVVVGDSLPSLGRIQSISFENNRWVVRGSTGNVSQ